MKTAGFGVRHLVAKRSERALLRSGSRRLDLDDFSAEIRKRLRRHRRRHERHRVEARELDDLQPLERAHRLLVILESRHRYSTVSVFMLSIRSISSAIE